MKDMPARRSSYNTFFKKKVGLNETYLNSLDMSGGVVPLFSEAYSTLTPELRRELAHSPEGGWRSLGN